MPAKTLSTSCQKALVEKVEMHPPVLGAWLAVLTQKQAKVYGPRLKALSTVRTAVTEL